MSSNKTSLLGGSGGTYFDQKCPAGEHINQFYGYNSLNFGVFPSTINGIGARCSGGADLGIHGGGQSEEPWSIKLDKPEKNFSGSWTLMGSWNTVVNFMGNGKLPGSSWSDHCPSGAATGVYGSASNNVQSYGLQCGPPSNWCMDNLEDPMCEGVDASTLNKACIKNFSETCTNRKSDLTDSTMNLYCAANPTAAICSCYSQVPSYIPQEMAGLAPCWNKACATTGYIPQNMRGACPSITVCKQEIGTSGDSNMLTNNVILQDCGGKTNLANPDPHQDSKPPSDRAIQEANISAERARTIAKVDSDIWTPVFIIILIIVGVIVGMCVYSLIQHFLKKKESDEDDEDKPADE